VMAPWLASLMPGGRMWRRRSEACLLIATANK
jgi:hypothetical protein